MNVKPYLLLFFFIPCLLAAQAWAPLGATWQYYEISDVGTEIFAKITVERDTVVAGQPCRKYTWQRQVPDTDSTVFGYNGYTFERNDSVFVWEHEVADFVLRYDFSAQVGDTIALPFFDYLYIQMDTLRVVLEDRAVVPTGAGEVPLERYQTRRISGSTNYWGDTYYRTIGSAHVWGGLRLSQFAVVSDLRCYQDGTTTIEGTTLGGGCSRPSDTSAPNSPGNLRVYPNPSDGVFRFEHAFDSPATLFIYSATGQLVGQQALSSMGSAYEWQPATSTAATYFYRMLDADGRVCHQGKLVFGGHK